MHNQTDVQAEAKGLISTTHHMYSILAKHIVPGVLNKHYTYCQYANVAISTGNVHIPVHASDYKHQHILIRHRVFEIEIYSS